jgi:DNA modification methylase
MTSPPYWALRDYGIMGQVGLESDFREYISKLLLIFDELWRVLKRTGSFYLNMGDTYSGGGSHSKLGGIETWGKQYGMKQGFPDKSPQASITAVIPAKCMVGIPWRVALGLIDHGWILRNDIIWHKSNSMPSSVKDRLTNTYEHIFHFAKSKKYYYNLDAIREPHITKYAPFNIRVGDAQRGRLAKKWGRQYSASEEEIERYNEKLYAYIKEIAELAKHYRNIGYSGKSNAQSNKGWSEVLKIAHAYREATKTVIEKYNLEGQLAKALRDYAQNHLGNPLGRNPGDVVRYPPHEPRHFQLLSMNIAHGGHAVKHDHPLGKNPGDLWKINSKPHPFAHFAVYPEEICVRPILSSCPEQVCVTCGTPRLPIVQASMTTSEGQPPPGTTSAGEKYKLATNLGRAAGRTRFPVRYEISRKVLGYTNCGCNDGFRPGIVLDMFAGSGTTLVVAKKLGRNFIGIELNPEYVEIAEGRLATIQGFA